MNPTFNKYFLAFIFIAISLEGVLFIVSNNKLNLNYLNSNIQIQKSFDSLEVEAKAFSVYDQTLNKKIYGRNDEKEMPIASLTKIMTVVVALNESHKESEDIVYIPLNSIKKEGDYGISAGEKFKIKDLAKFTLVGSVNDGADALSQKGEDFIKKMNEKAQKIGMDNTLFFNSTGLDIDDGFAGAYASAEDVNTMAMFALKLNPEVFGASVMPKIDIKSMSGINHSIKNTDIIIDKIPNILFSKTGYTPLAGGNLTIIYKNDYGHEIALTVLGSTMEGRFSDIERIINALYDLKYGSADQGLSKL